MPARGHESRRISHTRARPIRFTEAPYLERFGLAARHGFRAVESLFPYADAPAEAVAAELKRHGLVQVLVNAPPGDWHKGDRGVGGIEERGAEHAASIGSAIEYATAIGCQRVHVLAGLKADGATEDTFVGRLRAAALVAEAAGVRLCVEALNGHDVPGYLVPSLEDAARIVDAVGHPGCGLQLDLYHLQKTAGPWPSPTVRDAIRAYAPRAAHVQIAGPDGRHEPDEEAAAAMLALLHECGYTGFVGCEYNPAGGTSQGLAWARRFGVAAPSPG